MGRWTFGYVRTGRIFVRWKKENDSGGRCHSECFITDILIIKGSQGMEEQDQNLELHPGKGTAPTSEELWNEDTYTAWVARFGTPSEASAKLIKEPSAKLYPLSSYFGDVQGKKMMNLMGSNGMKAVALSLLGADVTVADFSEANARYAADLAQEAGVQLNYIVSDVLKLPDHVLDGSYDIVFAELGIVHYFTDLAPFMETVHHLLSPGGIFVLRDFHPVTTKLISSKGSTAKVRKHKVSGDYFDTTLEEKRSRTLSICLPQANQ